METTRDLIITTYSNLCDGKFMESGKILNSIHTNGVPNDLNRVVAKLEADIKKTYTIAQRKKTIKTSFATWLNTNKVTKEELATIL